MANKTSINIGDRTTSVYSNVDRAIKHEIDCLNKIIKELTKENKKLKATNRYVKRQYRRIRDKANLLEEQTQKE